MNRYFVVPMGAGHTVIRASQATGDWGQNVVAEVDESLYMKEIKLEDGQWVVDTDAQAIADTEANKAEQKNQLYAAMSSEVLNEMKKVFLTGNQHSANAWHETWKLMMSDPNGWKDEGFMCPENLLDDNDALIFAIGRPLNTSNEIQTYAQRKLDQALAYGKWRVQRIAQYTAAVAAL